MTLSSQQQRTIRLCLAGLDGCRARVEAERRFWGNAAAESVAHLAADDARREVAGIVRLDPTHLPSFVADYRFAGWDRPEGKT